uniref:Uncharacterized protein n=1 Tax=Kuenenia stuttgartiensis TaxID=174633 RepID=Q1Q6K1_KUEST|nr:unknown protein [Candidatus Kuenenia stuttgartiensis]
MSFETGNNHLISQVRNEPQPFIPNAPPLHYYPASSSTIVGIFQKTKVLPNSKFK